MAEYTIPKPYRDFYVTNPYIELKESNERLQRIVKSGYVATDHFEGQSNRVITFNKEKHGFSLSNESTSKIESYSIDISDASLWTQSTISSHDGTDRPYELKNRVRCSLYFPAYANATYTFSMTDGSFSDYTPIIFLYDANKKYCGYYFGSTSITPTNNGISNVAYFRIVIRNTTPDTDIPLSTFLSSFTKFTLSVTSYTAPSDVTVKVAENVAGIPTTADGWEQGSINTTDGTLNESSSEIRTKGFISVNANTKYHICYEGKTSAGWVWVFEYDKNGLFIGMNKQDSNEYDFTTHENVQKIKLLLTTNLETKTPEAIINDLSCLRITSEKMIVQADDTRIVTMPPFTSLYIESNVPYHGHALDLAE